VLNASSSDGQLRVTVADAGEGIPEELRPRLFDQFVRGAGASALGSGLGLAIARSYAQAHGGDLRYVDTGGGAGFELVLPASGAASRPPLRAPLPQIA
jgi:signal transduction histidine kinase